MEFEQIDFYYFSGTGNTLLVVKKMKEVFERNGVSVNLYRIETSRSESVDPRRPIGLGFTVACQGTYPFVWDFIKALPDAPGTPIFMVDTLAGFSGGLVGPVRRIVKKKGYRPIGAKEIKMPNNLFSLKASNEKKAASIQKGLAKAEEYANRILNGRSRWGRVPFLSDFVSRLSLGEWAWEFLRKKFEQKVNTSKCTKCGLCAKLCPVNNIEMKEFPEFKDRCVMCMRCKAFCPQQAIYQGKDNYDSYHAVEANELLESQP